MKRLLLILLFCAGCALPPYDETPIKCYPDKLYGKELIIVPIGASVGGVITEKHGVYMTTDKYLEWKTDVIIQFLEGFIDTDKPQI
jgi:hypothetical protein